LYNMCKVQLTLVCSFVARFHPAFFAVPANKIRPLEENHTTKHLPNFLKIQVTPFFIFFFIFSYCKTPLMFMRYLSLYKSIGEK